jgi:hypothetical protein
LRSKVCSQSNAKFIEISSPSEGVMAEKKLNSTFNFSLRFDEVPRTLVIQAGKLAGSVLGFRNEDLQKLVQLIPGIGPSSRPNDSVRKPKKDFMSQPEAPQEAPGLLSVPSGTSLCADSVTKLLKKTSTKLATSIDHLQQFVRDVPATVDATDLSDVKAGCQELATRFHSAVFFSRSDLSIGDDHSKPRRLYESGRHILERCNQAEQKLIRAKNVADFKASQMQYIGESVNAMEVMTESKSLEQWLVDDCDFMYQAHLPRSMSSPLAHQLRGDANLDSPGAFSPYHDTLAQQLAHSSGRSAGSPQVHSVGQAASPGDSRGTTAAAERARRQQRAKEIDRILKTCERQSRDVAA